MGLWLCACWGEGEPVGKRVTTPRSRLSPGAVTVASSLSFIDVRH